MVNILTNDVLAKKEMLITFERKILRKISGLVIQDNQWRIRTNTEL